MTTISTAIRPPQTALIIGASSGIGAALARRLARDVIIYFGVNAAAWVLTSTMIRGLARVGRLGLTNCETYDQFPPDKLKKAAALCRTLPGLATSLMRLQIRLPGARRRLAASVTAKTASTSLPSTVSPTTP